LTTGWTTVLPSSFCLAWPSLLTLPRCRI
jgi:hypothetical protein